MTDAILIPMKRLADAKRRLAARLPAEARRRLGLVMLADVLQATEGWDLRLLVTSDPEAEAVGRACGCVTVADPGRGLNAALAEGTAAAAGLGARAVLVLPADVPLVTAGDVAAIFAADAQVAVAATEDGGTAALLLRPPDVIPAAFGPSSAEAHLSAGRQRGVRVCRLALPSLAFDVDDAAGLERLARASERRPSVLLARELTRIGGRGEGAR